MFIHKYTSGDDVFYRLSAAKAGPSKIVTLTRDDWKGVSAGSNVSNAVKFLNSLAFSKDIPEEKEEEKKAPEPGKKASLASMIRSVVSNHQAQ
jgi:hypothetical protein